MGSRILLIDDSGGVRAELRAALDQGFPNLEFLEARDGLEGFKQLAEERPDLVICDLVMPVLDGLKFLQMRASRQELLHSPVLVLTGEAELDKKVTALDHGAADYIVKPFDRKELMARVRVHLRVKALQDELREANQRLEHLVRTDWLTGLFNRQCFDELLRKEFARALRHGTPFSLVMIDVDHFKAVNDTYGHAVGDEVLRNVSRVLGALVRKSDSVARYGGEEFAVLLPHTQLEGARRMAERLRHQLAELLHRFGDVTLQSTASFGVATLDPRDAPADPIEILNQADAALYRAKREGRNRVVTQVRQ